MKSIRLSNSVGASEWLVISAVVVKAEKDREVAPWTRAIVQGLKQHQITHLHFRDLKDSKKLQVCSQLADLPVRFFTVISHKRNMQNYTNLNAEMAKINKTAWFYCWMSRLLLERVTRYCGSRSIKDYGESRHVRIEFSDRGGVKIDDFVSYYEYLSQQSRLGMMYHSSFDLDWSVVDLTQITSHPNKMRAGLQLADVVASAFFQALEPNSSGNVTADYAKALRPRMAINNQGRMYGYSFKVMPKWAPARLPPQQREIFNFFAK